MRLSKKSLGFICVTAASSLVPGVSWASGRAPSVPDGLCCMTPTVPFQAREPLRAPRIPQNSLIVLTFEGLLNQEEILNYYNGGLGGSGSGPGPSDGITFSPTALAIIDSDAGGTGNFGGEPSPSTIMFFLSGTAVMNVPAGFTTGFSFFYSAINSTGSITVYDDVNATGNVLATLNLPLTPFNGAPDPTGQFSPLVPIGVSFNGTAKSVDFGGTVNQIGFDNVTFGSATPESGAAVEVPTISVTGLVLMAGLLALAGIGVLRKFIV
jgi:hypothetical protein